MIHQGDPLQQDPFEGQEAIQEETQEAAEEDFPMEVEEDHRAEEYPTGEATIMEGEDQISWWETLQKYSKEYERKLSLSLLFGGSTQALTAKILPSPTPINKASYSSRIFKGTMWPSGSSR